MKPYKTVRGLVAAIRALEATEPAKPIKGHGHERVESNGSVIEMLALEVGRLTAALTAGAIIAGVGITFYILRSGKKIALPGLPIPVLLAFVVIGLSYLL